MKRPLPVDDLAGELRNPEIFRPAPEVERWLRSVFIEADGELYNEEHQHLSHATIGVLWTNASNTKSGDIVAGTAEMPQVNGAQWSKARQRWLLNEWFGDVPDFVITLDAVLCAQARDIEFCALVEHELLHCAQARNAYGMPKFSKETGLPIFAMRGHDVEEFVSIARRYGPRGVLNPKLRELVEVSLQVPQVAEGAIRLACGTCAALV